MNESKEQQYKKWYVGGEALLFRNPGKPKVDFYPSTGRWRIVGSNSKAKSGGAHRFLDWYKRQRA